MKKGNFPHRKEQKRKEATARAEAWSLLSSKEKIYRLDTRLGKGTGAKKQRARIAKAK